MRCLTRINQFTHKQKLTEQERKECSSSMPPLCPPPSPASPRLTRVAQRWCLFARSRFSLSPSFPCLAGRCRLLPCQRASLTNFRQQEFEEQHCHIVGGQFKRAPGRVPALVMSCWAMPSACDRMMAVCDGGSRREGAALRPAGPVR